MILNEPKKTGWSQLEDQYPWGTEAKWEAEEFHNPRLLEEKIPIRSPDWAQCQHLHAKAIKAEMTSEVVQKLESCIFASPVSSPLLFFWCCRHWTPFSFRSCTPSLFCPFHSMLFRLHNNLHCETQRTQCVMLAEHLLAEIIQKLWIRWKFKECNTIHYDQ